MKGRNVKMVSPRMKTSPTTNIRRRIDRQIVMNRDTMHSMERPSSIPKKEETTKISPSIVEYRNLESMRIKREPTVRTSP